MIVYGDEVISSLFLRARLWHDQVQKNIYNHCAMTPTLVLSPRFTPDSTALWRAAIEAGWRVERLQSHHPPDYLQEQDVILYGEALFANIVAERLSLALLEPPFRWLADLPHRYLNRKVLYTTLADARKLAEPTFVKPAYDKSFASTVYPSGEQLPSSEILPDEMPVLIAEPVIWEVEFRCFILNRQIMTLSVYVRNGELAQNEEGEWVASQIEMDQAQEFTSSVLTDTHISVAPAFALDVGKITDKGWAIVEANPAWASGIYGCDPARILPVLRRACIRQSDLGKEDKKWVWQREV